MRKVLLSDRSLQLLFGPLDENIRFLENLFEVTIQARDSSLTIDGEEEDVGALEKILIDLNDKELIKFIRFLLDNSPEVIAEKRNITIESATHYKMWAEYLVERYKKIEEVSKARI